MASYADLALMVGLMLGLAGDDRAADAPAGRTLAAGGDVGLVGAALSFLASMNQFPVQEFGYPTTDSYSSFVASQALQALLGRWPWADCCSSITAGAEPLYRAAFPGRSVAGQSLPPRRPAHPALLPGRHLGFR